MGFMNSTFPLAVYGLQDAFSGYILYLKLWTTNSDPKLIGRWYMDHLYSTKGNLSCFNNIYIQIVIQLKRALISTDLGNSQKHSKFELVVHKDDGFYWYSE